MKDSLTNLAAVQTEHDLRDVSSEPVATLDPTSQSEVPLTRRIEASVFLSDHSTRDATFTVPATTTFEACASAFARGTLITTVMGPIAVEDLIPGDLIETHRGPEPVMWIGSTEYLPNFKSDTTSLSYLLRLPGNDFERSDLLLGPAARLVIRQDRFADILNCDAVRAPASDYIDGDRIIEIVPQGAVRLYHFALRRHGIVRANGHELESYHPGRVTSAELGTNVSKLLQTMFTHVDELQGFGDLAFPRTSREVLETLRVA